jgi:hypothetical protein
MIQITPKSVAFMRSATDATPATPCYTTHS